MPIHKGEWIHDRAKYIISKNPGIKKDIAYGVATQQSYAAGKAPKDWGTRAGRIEAAIKHDEPKSTYLKTADPGQKGKSKKSSIDLVFWRGFSDELEKIAANFAAPDPSKPLGLSGLKRTVTATHRKPSYSKVHTEPAAPAPFSTTADSAKSIQPPPATMPSGA